MKKTLLFLTLLPTLLCADNLFKNSDMSQVAAWQGQGLYRPETEGDMVVGEGNTVRLLKAQPHKIVAFSQSIDISKVRFLEIKFRYKTSDLTGGGFELQSKVPNQYPDSYEPTLTTDGKWHQYHRTFTGYDKIDRVEFFFCLLPGSGSVAFDDITVEAVPGPVESGSTP